MPIRSHSGLFHRPQQSAVITPDIQHQIAGAQGHDLLQGICLAPQMPDHGLVQPRTIAVVISEKQMRFVGVPQLY